MQAQYLTNLVLQVKSVYAEKIGNRAQGLRVVEAFDWPSHGLRRGSPLDNNVWTWVEWAVDFQSWPKRGVLE
jgi:hypothetical protein